MSPPPVMKFELVGSVLVGVHAEAAPPAPVWHAHCEWIRAIRSPIRGVLVYTRGGGPDSKQRRALREAQADRPPVPTAILTESRIARGIITSMNWFRPSPVLAFAPPDLAGALRHLRCTEDAELRDDVVLKLRSLARELQIPLPHVVSDKTSLRPGP